MQYDNLPDFFHIRLLQIFVFGTLFILLNFTRRNTEAFIDPWKRSKTFFGIRKMKKNRQSEQPDIFPPEEPALTPEARENQLISMAERLAEKQLREGTASSQIIVHYLRLATVKEQLEREKIKYETELLKAKKDSVESGIRSEETYANAIRAFQAYRGEDNGEYC